MRSLRLAITLAAFTSLSLIAGCPDPNPVGCDSDSECDDLDPCTTNTCLEDGACANEPLLTPECACATAADCDPAGACRAVSCVEGSCRSEFVPGCCEVDSDCVPPEDPCQRAACVESACTEESIPGCPACVAAGDCDDGDACTTDTCAAGACENATIPGCGGVVDRTFTVPTGPEGMAVIGVGGAPFSSPFLGLAADADHVLVVAGTETGVSDVNLLTGTVTELFSPWGAYGLDCFRTAAGDRCAAPGPFGWYVLSTGATLTDASGNATDAIASPRDAAGISTEVLYVQAARLRAVRTDFGAPREVPATAFPGDTFPGRPTSAAYLEADTVVVLFDDGELWTAPLSAIGESADGTRVGDLGGAAASMRYLNCTPPGGERVCVATNFGEDTAHLIHIDGAGALRFGPVIDTGAGPVEADIHVAAGGYVVGSAGFDDDVIRIHFYDGTAAVLEDTGTFTDCDAPGHAAWVDDQTLAVTCNGSGTLRILGRGFDD